MCLIIKTLGANFRYMAVDTQTGEVIASGMNFFNLRRSLRRHGYYKGHVKAYLLRGAA